MLRAWRRSAGSGIQRFPLALHTLAVPPLPHSSGSMPGPSLRLLDLPDELLRAIAARCGSQGLGGLLGACTRLNSLLRPQLGTAWLRGPSAAAAARSLAALRPSRFAGLHWVVLRSDAALACNLERLQVRPAPSSQASARGGAVLLPLRMRSRCGGGAFATAAPPASPSPAAGAGAAGAGKCALLLVWVQRHCPPHRAHKPDG